MTSLDPTRARSFGRYADAYDRYRPSYPAEAVSWLLPPQADQVAEVGAGTGKLTAGLLDHGVHVHAIEPDPDMLGLLARRCPGATRHLASADALPIPDSGVDAVLVADAWHWFPHAEALDEVRRVVRPGGWLGLVWNLVDPVTAWERELAGQDPDAASTSASVPTVPGLEGEDVDVQAFPWAWSVTPEQIRGFTATHSGVAALHEPARTQRLDDAEAVVALGCAEAGTDSVPMHLRAFCVRWRPT